MNATQQRFLLNRLDEARRAKPAQYEEVRLAEPAEVKRAKSIVVKATSTIKRWEDKKRRAREQRNERVYAAFNKVKSVILFKDSKAALAAIENFERMKF